MRAEEQIRLVTRFKKRRALTVPKSTGRRVPYKTVLFRGTCRGDPMLGRVDVRSFVIRNDLRSFESICFSLRFLFRDATVG